MRISASLAIAGALVASAVVSGCASTSSGSVYSGGQARQEQTVRMGVVESVRQVSIEGSKSGVGAVAGGVAGGAWPAAISAAAKAAPSVLSSVRSPGAWPEM